MTQILLRRIPLLLLLLASTFAAGCSEKFEDIVVVDNEKEANRILVVLDTRGIAALKETTTANRETVYAVKVPANEASRARQILVDLDLPQDTPAGLADCGS